MPDYDIRIVTTGNVLDYGSDPWIVEQLKNENGIGCSQWARLFWLQQLGGIYVDMDQEAVKRWDPLLEDRFFAAHLGGEPSPGFFAGCHGKEEFIGNGMMGSVPGHLFLQEQLWYLSHLDVKDKQFGNESGPRMITNLLRKRGWVGGDCYHRFPGNIVIYPHTVFYPYFWKEKFTPECIKPDTLAVHHWASSWDQHGEEH
jgi:hypothetical protein